MLLSPERAAFAPLGPSPAGLLAGQRPVALEVLLTGAGTPGMLPGWLSTCPSFPATAGPLGPAPRSLLARRPCKGDGAGFGTPTVPPQSTS
mmetsp:Transcript_12467/g.35015  ORF Transcript_12467/g.35015 Transcript_12467/m.35015 type:complete len:91 (+) Transcript_12467:655-927(+)